MGSRREFACALLIDVQGRYLFQERDDIPGIIQPGKVGLFGGQREGDETFLQCMSREILEETGLAIPAEQFEPITIYEGSDIDGAGGEIAGAFFVARDIPVDKLAIVEGTLLIAMPADLTTLEPRFTPFTRFSLDALRRISPL
jgi:8-oxo-dGTP diphosphatase